MQIEQKKKFNEDIKKEAMRIEKETKYEEMIK